MSFNLKNVFKTTGIIVVFGIIGAFLSKNGKDEFYNWLKSASDDELADRYEYLRQQWAKTGYGGNGEKTPEMKKIDREMSDRTAEKWENDPRRNKDTNYRWTDANRWD